MQIDDLTGKIAALPATTADQIAVSGVAVNPISGSVYISVHRGLGADAKLVILKADRAGKFTELKLDSATVSAAALADAPAPDAKNARGQLLRAEAITDVGYINGQILVAGLSNEEFAS